MYANMKLLQEQLGLPAQIADIEHIRQILGQEKLILVGHSFGAVIVALYAAEFPERVLASIYVAPADLMTMPVSDDTHLFALVRSRLPESMRKDYAAYEGEYFDFRRAFARSEEQSSEFYERFAVFYGAATQERLSPGKLPSPGYEPLAIYISMGKHHRYAAALRNVTSPVLVVHGSRDLQPESESKHFASYFVNARSVAIPDAGHFVFDDQPDQFAKVIREFLTGLPDIASSIH